MKVLQLNVWMNRLDNVICDLIEKEDPDVVCIQEIFSCEKNVGYFKTLENINSRLGFEHLYFSPVYNLRFTHKKVEFGNLIFSKFPITNSSTEFTNGEYEDDWNLNDAGDNYNIRNFQYVEIDVNGKKLNVLNHHGYHNGEHKNGGPETLRAAKQISEFINKLDGPVVLTGDFNLIPDSESIKLLEGSLRDLTAEYNLKTTRSILIIQNEPCDYIFINDQVKLKDFHMCEEVVSDHNALVAEFEI